MGNAHPNLGNAHPNFNTGVNRGRKQVGLPAAFLGSASFSTTPAEENRDSYKRALGKLVDRTRAVYGLSCMAEIVSMPKSLPRDVAETLFQAVRELLINVAKHAGATQARLICRRSERSMLVQVVDDGQGFEPARVSVLNRQHGGFGLLSLRERLALLGGNMHIDSAPGQGTQITITLPVDTRAHA